MNKETNKSNEDITCKEAGGIVKNMIQTIEDRMADGEKIPPESNGNNKSP